MRSGVRVSWFWRVFLAVFAFDGWAVALAQDNATTIPVVETDSTTNGVLRLWKGMFDAGMIDDVQYQYVLQNGRLPNGSTVQNSPVEPARQSVWQGLAEKKVITPEELAHMLFRGGDPESH